MDLHRFLFYFHIIFDLKKIIIMGLHVKILLPLKIIQRHSLTSQLGLDVPCQCMNVESPSEPRLLVQLLDLFTYVSVL